MKDKNIQLTNNDSILVLSGEPYSSTDVIARTDPEKFIIDEEQWDHFNWYLTKYTHDRACIR